MLRSLPEDSECFVVLDCCHAGSMVDLPFVCDRDKAAKKSLTAPPPAVRIHLLASSRDHSSDAQAYGAANRAQWAGVLSAMLLHSLRPEQTWGQLLEDVRA